MIPLGAAEPGIVAKRDVGLSEQNPHEHDQAGAQVDRERLEIRHRKSQPVAASFGGGDPQRAVGNLVEHCVSLAKLCETSYSCAGFLVGLGRRRPLRAIMGNKTATIAGSIDARWMQPSLRIVP